MSAILESLIAVGIREGIDEALHYGSKHEHLALHLGKSGKVLKLEHCENSPVRIPWPVSRTSNVKPNLLYDSPVYLDGKKANKWEKSAQLHQGWCARTPNHPAVKAVERFFAKGPHTLAIPTKHKTLDLVLYFDGKPVCEHPELYDAIREELRERHTFFKHPSRFDDGDECVLDMHGKVSLRGLDNPQALLGYNNNVTWNVTPIKTKRMLHCAMSYESMRNYVGGLTWLKDHRVLPAVGVKSGVSILWVGWGEEKHRIEEVVEAVLRGCRKGEKVEQHRAWLQEHLDADTALFEDETKYHLMVLGCDARIAVRGFHTMTVAQLARNLVAYLDDFSWPTRTGLRRAMTPPYAVLKMGEPQVKATTALVESFGNAIFLGTPYPRALEQIAMDAYVESSMADEEGRPSISSDATMLAISNRRLATSAGLKMNHTTVHEDTITHPSFIIGRMFSVLEARNLAAKDRGDSVKMSRALARALSNPARVILGELWILTEQHLQKLRNRKHRTYSQELSELFAQMEESLKTRGRVEWPGRGSSEDKQFFIRGRMYQEKIERDAKAERILAHEKTKEAKETENRASAQ